MSSAGGLFREAPHSAVTPTKVGAHKIASTRFGDPDFRRDDG